MGRARGVLVRVTGRVVWVLPLACWCGNGCCPWCVPGCRFCKQKNGAAVPVCGDGMAVWGWGLVVYFLGDGLGVVVVVYGDGDGVVVIIVAGDDFEDGGGVVGGVVGGDAGDGAGCLVDDGGSVDEFVGVLVVDDVFDALNVVVGDDSCLGHELGGDDGGHCVFLLVVSWGLGFFSLSLWYRV